MIRTLLLLSVVYLAGCTSPCQALCEDLAAYAGECGFTVGDDEIDTCRTTWSRKETDDARQLECEEHGDDLRDEWTCEDVEACFLAD